MNALMYILPLMPLFAAGIAFLLIGAIIGEFALAALGLSLLTIHICLLRVIMRRWRRKSVKKRLEWWEF